MHSRHALAVIALFAGLTTAAQAATDAGVEVTPGAARPGERVAVAGYGWPGGDCRGSVTLFFKQRDLRVRLGRFALGEERRPDGVGPTGRDFTARVRIPRSAAAGRARLVARQPCGGDVLERSAGLRVRARR